MRVTQEIDIEKICKQHFVALIASRPVRSHHYAHKTTHPSSRRAAPDPGPKTVIGRVPGALGDATALLPHQDQGGDGLGEPAILESGFVWTDAQFAHA